jgi:release factor glutamine methyltransferase
VVVDLGTGSGAIAIVDRVEAPRYQVWATDVSVDALAVAQANCAGLGRVARHVTLVQGSWFDPLPESLRGTDRRGRVEPAYVAADDELPADVREWEPLEALVPGPAWSRGLRSNPGMRTNGWRATARWCSRSERRKVRRSALVRDSGFATADVHTDLAGRDRVLVARR